jgi:hypothetical protein
MLKDQEPDPEEVKVEVRDQGNLIQILLPSTFTQEQKERMADTISQHLQPGSRVLNKSGYYHDDGLRPGGVWSVRIDARQGIVVMNVNGRGKSKVKTVIGS